MVIDDLHASDTPSLLLLRFVAGQLQELPILLVGTYRDVELTPEHPLMETVTELVRRPVTRWIGLRGLDERDAERYLEAAVGGEVEAAVVSTLHRQTKGNSLFLIESVRLLAAGGDLTTATAAPLHSAIPSGVRDVIARRVAALSDAWQAQGAAHGGGEDRLRAPLLVGKRPGPAHRAKGHPAGLPPPPVTRTVNLRKILRVRAPTAE